MDNTLTYVDIFMVIIGIYMLVSILGMKKKMQIPSMLLAREEQLKVKDKKGFIGAIYQPSIVFSLVMIVLGAAGVVNDTVVTIPFFTYIELAVFMVLFLWFMKKYQAARREFIY